MVKVVWEKGRDMGLGGFVKRLFSSQTRDLDAARQAELRGDLAKAAELFGRADADEDVARIMMLRADAEPDPRARLSFFVQAAAAAPSESAIRKDARIRRAKTMIALAKGSVQSAAIRMDLLAAAKELEELGEAADAADAYRMCGDPDAEARALAAAGKIDELEALLEHDQAKERLSIATRVRGEKIDEALSSGRRRDALALCDVAAKADPNDRGARDGAESLRAKRATGLVASVAIHGKNSRIVLGEEVVVGRSEGQIQIPSHAVSRRHLALFRRDGVVFARDLESRNGTTLRGMRIANELPIGGGIDLSLGNEVPISIAPCDDLEGGIAIEVGGVRYVAPLGAAKLGVGDWELACGEGDWLELRFSKTPAFLAQMSLASPVTLLVHDAISSERDAPPALEIRPLAQG